MIQPAHKTDILNLLSAGSRQLEIDLSPQSLNKILGHIDLCRQWNSLTNLTANRSFSKMAVNNYLDSLTLFKVIDIGRGYSLIDLGTGAGFPGMVAKIVDESLQLTLLDKNPRKIVFLKYAARNLNLSGVQFINSTIDAYLKKRPTDTRFSVVVSRAVSSDPAFLDGLADFVTPAGLLVVMSGPVSSSITSRISKFQVARSWEGFLPFSSSFRRIVAYKLL
jgi:16S rRNA (guanine527-N7)-methyltransferase